MKRVVLQIPLDPALRRAAEKKAEEQGFSSLQEAVRVFLKKLAHGALGVTFEEVVQLSPKAIKRYNKITDDFEKGQNVFTATSVDDLIRQLHERSLP